MAQVESIANAKREFAELSVEAEPWSGERLSAYMRRSKLIPGIAEQAGFYLPGLMLMRRDLQSAQTFQKSQLITELTLFDTESNSQSLVSLLELIRALPVTGRMTLSSFDVDQMAMRPELDPKMQPGDVVRAPTKPRSVTVVGPQGGCSVDYLPAVESPLYIQACMPADPVDTAWLVQPTGHVVSIKTGLWNENAQPVPMPGAWLVTVPRNSRLPEALALKVARILSTQGASLQLANSRNLPEKSLTLSPLRDLPVSSSTWGWVGLLQTPSARMRPAGSASVTSSRAAPYTRYSFVLQPFDWLEGGFRYSTIDGRTFGENLKYLDKNIDIKLRLLEETAFAPQVALGLNDIGGTALFASEYVVANKRFGRFDTSLGLAWGYLGSSGGLRNPLGMLSGRFDERPPVVFGQGGELSAGSYFRGRVALFGGVQWHTPWDDWVIKLEYEGNDYKNEPLANPQVQRSRFNYGVVYSATKSINLHLGIERGNTLSMAISLFENLSRFNTPKVSDPKSIAVTTAPRPHSVDWPHTLKSLQDQTGWQVSKVEERGGETKLTVRNGRAAYYNHTLERASEVLHQDLPDSVRWFTLGYEQHGVDMGQHVVDRAQFVTRRTDLGSALPDASPARSEQVAMETSELPYKTVYEKEEKLLRNDFSIGYQQVFGGTDGLLYQFSLANDTRLSITKNTWLDGRLSYRLLDNYDKYKQIGTSRLPQVRTNLREYAITSDLTIPRLTLKHMGSVGPGHYYGLYGGLLESMFAGVGVEYLYRPFGSKLAIGVDLNRARQRSFEQDFSLRPYQVNTGHLTAYWDTGVQDVLATVSVGQYLAGDRGVTVDVSREFGNGVRMGAFATKTNVSAVDFGEGSFDKGIYVTIPLNAFFTKSIPGHAIFLWRPLTRDGGAKLDRGFSLYGETAVRNPKTLIYSGYDDIQAK